ncbi:MAG: hypothetical protein HUK15_05105, partial [Bacteroidales bacterium]|nr:hypothetical protein [Bacteroidales bacterium]
MILSQNAVKYTLKRIANIAFPNLSCRIEISPNPSIIIENSITINFPNCNDQNIEGIKQGKTSFSTVKSYDGKVDIKVQKIDNQKDIFSKDDNSVSVNADFVSIPFLLLSRYEEKLFTERDKFGRFMHKTSLTNALELTDIPIVDEYAMLIRKYVADNFPQIKIQPRQSRLMLSHDIDFLVRFRTFPQSVKTIFGDLLARRSVSMFWKSAKSYTKSRNTIEEDMYFAAFMSLIKQSTEKNIESTFYFKALTPKDADYSYDIFADYSQKAIQLLLENNINFGLHGGIGTQNDSKLFSAQKANLEKVSKQAITCNRQHFLLF